MPEVVDTPQENEDKEVEFEKAVEEPTQEDSAPAENVVEILEPSAEVKTWTLKDENFEREYKQKPMSYFQSLKFFGLVGETIDRAVSTGMDLNTVFGGQTLSTANFADMNSFLGLAAKLAGYSEDFLKECYVIWLNVPRDEQPWAKDAMEDLTHDEGEEIINTFIDQNWETIEDFFTNRVRKIGQRIQKNRESFQNSQPSTRSKPSRGRMRRK